MAKCTIGSISTHCMILRNLSRRQRASDDTSPLKTLFHKGFQTIVMNGSLRADFRVVMASSTEQCPRLPLDILNRILEHSTGLEQIAITSLSRETRSLPARDILVKALRMKKDEWIYSRGELSSSTVAAS